MPVADLTAMLRLADQLGARERLDAIRDGTVASGWAKRATVSRHLGELERVSRGGRAGGPGERRAPTQQAIDASLHKFGIQVTRPGDRGG